MKNAYLAAFLLVSFSLMQAQTDSTSYNAPWTGPLQGSADADGDDTSVQLAGSGINVGVYAPVLLWNTIGMTYGNAGAARLSSSCEAGAPSTASNNGTDGILIWSAFPTCLWEWTPFGTNHTPIVIDTDGSGFHLTSAKNGILWNFYGGGTSGIPPQIQIAWTEKGSTNGWLAIDLDDDGKIDSARELFSDVSYHMPPPRGCNEPDCHNGFNSLMYYDSNNDGVIDNKDTDWPRLLVWIDSNHDGISQPNELHHLDDLGIHSISLKWEKSSKADQYGNKFRFRGTINADDNPDGVHREIYDVFLRGQYQPDYERSAKENICWDRFLQKPVSCDNLSDRNLRK